MFGQQNTINNGDKANSVIDPRTIPVRTMQDDLDVLSGKVKDPGAVNADFKKNNLGSGLNQSSAAGVGGAIQESPFMEKSRPVAVNVPVEAQKTATTLGNPFPPKKEAAGQSASSKTSGIPVGIPISQPNILGKPLKANNFGKTAGMLTGVGVLLVAVGSGYYFYMTRYNTPASDLVAIPTENVAQDVPDEVPEAVIPEKFSADKPNYLLIDVEEMNIGDLQKLFAQKAQEMKEDGKSQPIEFVITDNNNNPIAFKIFTLLMEIKLSPKFLEGFGDDFSMFIFRDQENVRLGLKLTPKDMAKVLASAKTEEKTLVKGLSSLFMGEAVKNQALSFQNAQYKDVEIRYMNLNVENSMSVDYFTNADSFILATSKHTTWAIIDKLGEKD